MLKERAKAITSLSDLMSGREKGITSDLINQKLTVQAVDLTRLLNNNTGEIEDVPVIIFKEISDKFYFGGTVWKQIIEGWCELYDTPTPLKDVNDDLQKEDVVVEITSGRTKKGNNITRVEVL